MTREESRMELSMNSIIETTDYILETEIVPNPLTLSTSGAQIRPGGVSASSSDTKLFLVSQMLHKRDVLLFVLRIWRKREIDK